MSTESDFGPSSLYRFVPSIFCHGTLSLDPRIPSTALSFPAEVHACHVCTLQLFLAQPTRFTTTIIPWPQAGVKVASLTQSLYFSQVQSSSTSTGICNIPTTSTSLPSSLGLILSRGFFVMVCTVDSTIVLQATSTITLWPRNQLLRVGTNFHIYSATSTTSTRAVPWKMSSSIAVAEK